MINRKMVNAAYNGNCLYKSSGMANAFDIFSNIQFSIFLLASSHMPAQAVALTHASQTGTVEGVKYFNNKYRKMLPPTTIPPTIPHSFRLQ